MNETTTKTKLKMTSNLENHNWPLPYGWIEQVDPNSGRTFYVDTKATPPRSIWTHPYEDEQYLTEHPDVREKVRASGPGSNLQPPPPEMPRRHSYNGQDSGRVSAVPAQKQGFFAKMKQKTEKSMEEHNERKRQQMLAMQEARQRAYNQGMPMSVGPGMYGPYAAPAYAYPQRGYGGMMGGRGGGMGGMGMALPMLGGFAGGMLLGDALNDDYDYGGGGGGDFGGGDFGGGF